MRRWSKFIRIFILFAGVVCIGFLFIRADAEIADRLPLTEWEYYWGDFPIGSDGDLQWESSADQEGIHDSHWLPAQQTMNLPGRGDWNVLWLRTTLPAISWKDPSLIIQIYENFKVYVNEQLVYQYGDVDNRGYNAYQGTPERVVLLPAEQEGGTLYIKIYSGSPNIGMLDYPELTGYSDYILSLHKQQAARFILGCFYIIAGLLSLYPFYKLRLKPFLSFGGFAISFGLYTICRTTIIYFYYDNPQVWMYLELVSLIAGMASAIILIIQLFEDSQSVRPMKWLWKVHLLYGLVYISSAYIGKVHLLTGLFYYQLLLFVTMAVTIVYLSILSFRRNREAQIVLLGTVCFSLAGSIDILDSMFFGMNIPSISYLGMLLLVLCLVIVLIRKSFHMINRLRYTEKLSLVGQLATGIAHEIRNPLTVISGNLQLMNKQPNKRDTVPLMLEEVNRINEILSELLYLSRTQPPTFEKYDLILVLKSVVALFRSQSTEQPIHIHFRNEEEEPLLIWCDANRLKQVFVNILRNGIEAMPEGGNMEVAVLRERDGVQIQFMDEGVGIDANDLPSLGMPFFTTKANGTGLGLAISHKIVEEHGGELGMFSRPQRGTMVVIKLPLRSRVKEKQGSLPINGRTSQS
ncbi:sensor histidine kinase [Chlamydia abortus]|uniref:ATP-binding protein n=1 Tax=Paenibacillus sp. SAFN-117 TaxID=3436860 RepID=UPI000A27DA0B|nr:sensor histidine kinase [Chlamydia abortus]